MRIRLQDWKLMLQLKEKTSYERIGGEHGLRELVNKFYDYMEYGPEAKTVRDLHPKDLRSSR